jgi:transposase InsO family protein
VAKAMGVSRQCGHRWVARFKTGGLEALHDRSSRPHSTPTRTSPEIEAAVVAARVEHRRGQDWLGPELGVPARTVSRILRRHDLPYLRELDPLTGVVIRASKTTAVRYERSRPGELTHMDVKKIGRIPDGGGWRAHGRSMGSTAAKKRTRIGFDYVHSLVDDHSRLAYSEILTDERKDTAAAFWLRAQAWFASYGIQVRRVLTDNGACYRSKDFAAALGQIVHKRTRPYRPQTNGKVERFNRTLLEEWAYSRPYQSEAERLAAFPIWLHSYNHHRGHTALAGQPPASRVTNLSGQNS